MKTVTPTQLRNDIYNILDQVLETGIPLEINRGGRLLKIVAVEKRNKLDNLVLRSNVIKADPDELVNISWEEEVNLDLP